MSVERSLRLFTFLITTIAVQLDIAMSVVSAVQEDRNYYYGSRKVTTFYFGFIPLTMTVVSSILSLQYTKKHGKSPTSIQFKVLDLVAVLAYIGVLIPIWVVEIRRLHLSGFGLLVGYTTAPMIVNM
jgi:divalent metal cation (Fe/Co/Zn/Cd) transporter